MIENSAIQAHMRAVVYQNYGGPEQLKQVQLAVPQPSESEVLVRVHASTVNRTDCGFLRGKPQIVRLFSGLFRPKSQILGCEFAGEVVVLGSEVTRFAVGDRVLGFKDDDHGFGGHAEYTCMPDSAMLVKIPDQFSYSEAAPALEGSHYALHYIRAAGVKAGHRVLVNGATGAIGSAAVQIIKAMGARVVAVCATEHLQLVQELGADRVIDYQNDDFTQCGETFDFGQRKVLFPIPENTQEDAEYISQLMAAGKFKPVIDRIVSIDDIADAYHYAETGMKTGNVVIQMVGD